jgi:hypothetical protein
LPVLLVALFAACATGNKWVRTGPSYQQRLSPGVRIAALADACIGIDKVGDDDQWSLDESLKAGRLMLEGAARKVAAEGYGTLRQWAPFACGAEVPQWRASQLQAPGEEGSDPGSGDTRLGQIRFEVTSKVRNWLDRRDTLGATGLQADQAFVDQVNLIGDRSGADLMLIFLGRGVKVTGGKQAGQAIATAILTLGMASVRNISYLDSWAALLDLKSGEVLWSNSRRFKDDPTDEEFYSAEWPDTIFEEFGAQGVVRPPQTAQDK